MENLMIHELKIRQEKKEEIVKVVQRREDEIVIKGIRWMVHSKKLENIQTLEDQWCSDNLSYKLRRTSPMMTSRSMKL